jgi:mono/diheme cytochrome c family protein
MKKALERKVLEAILLPLGFMLAAFAFSGARATPQKASTQDARLERLIYSLKGPDLFRANCAPCHGGDAKGDGPMAPALKAKVPDLTRLAKDNRGQFPAVRVRRLILGDDVSLSHGSREMPVWGPIFHQIEDDRDYGNVRLENLVKYLESIQQR